MKEIPSWAFMAEINRNRYISPTKFLLILSFKLRGINGLHLSPNVIQILIEAMIFV